MEVKAFSLSPLCSLGRSTRPDEVFLGWQVGGRRRSISNQLEQSKLPHVVSTVSKFKGLQADPERRSAHYHPSIWDPKLIDSFTTPFSYELYAIQLENLKEKTRRLLNSSEDHSALLKLVDSMQRLGVDYHFEEEIKGIMELVHSSVITGDDDLYTTALRFRLQRQYGYPVSSDVFDKFRNKDGGFMDSLSHDLKGILSLYEASYLGMPGEDDSLEEAKKFSIKYLKSAVENLECDSIIAKQVQLSLEIPLHWKMPRLEARNFIDIYQRDDTRSSVLLEFAILDYNIVQSVYQKELKELSRWWRDLGFKEKLSFSRDRLMENYLWAVGICLEPHMSKCRKALTRMVCILSAIDDVYDIYGSLDELVRFTNAVDRWEIEAMEGLPEYMKICYLATFNFGNEMVYDALKDYGLNIQPYIKEEWSNLCRAYLVEARWFYNGYKPTVREYLSNAWTSVGGPIAMVHARFLQGCTPTKDFLHACDRASDLIYWSSLITRLSDDLGTSKDEIMRGDVLKSIQCYMMEEGITEEEARERVKALIHHSWKKMNKEITAKTSLPKVTMKLSLNMARTAQCIFQHGDGIGTSNGVTKDRLISLIVKPIQTNLNP
ncbi:probable terpene synthase 9 [Malania oleifera]|uniref:probable terpene synthase 9 n=1 Tax=Malania oleifera TaxID=397392 RepID=UPI0025AE5E98|nr:probable terpene synthase 9 [Malania oleifera]